MYYYITVMNENYAHPAMPAGAEATSSKACICSKPVRKTPRKSSLIGAGNDFSTKSSPLHNCSKTTGAWTRICIPHQASPNWHAKAKRLSAKICSTRSPRKLARRNPVARLRRAPVIAATDYMRAVAEQIRAILPSLHRARYRRLWPSDTRENCVSLK